jgi:hypothetical protein
MNIDPNLNYENLAKYIGQFKCCDPTSRCVSKNVTIEVENFNEPPSFTPNTTGITIKEDLVSCLHIITKLWQKLIMYQEMYLWDLDFTKPATILVYNCDNGRNNSSTTRICWASTSAEKGQILIHQRRDFCRSDTRFFYATYIARLRDCLSRWRNIPPVSGDVCLRVPCDRRRRFLSHIAATDVSRLRLALLSLNLAVYPKYVSRIQTNDQIEPCTTRTDFAGAVDMPFSHLKEHNHDEGEG